MPVRLQRPFSFRIEGHGLPRGLLSGQPRLREVELCSVRVVCTARVMFIGAWTAAREGAGTKGHTSVVGVVSHPAQVRFWPAPMRLHSKWCSSVVAVGRGVPPEPGESSTQQQMHLKLADQEAQHGPDRDQLPLVLFEGRSK